MIARSAVELAQAVGGDLAAGSGSALVCGVSIDSRTISAGDAFFAIRGPRHDGHAFVAEAAARGAAAAVVDTLPSPAPPIPVIRVADTTAALGALAADERRRRSGLLLVAVTGSAGKTTTRELIGAALGARYRTATSPGNLNNQWGLPLALLSIPEDAQAAVVELGMNHPGEIAALTRLARPDIGVITNAGSAHIGFFDGERAVAAAKVELFDEMPAGAPGVVDGASATLLELARRSGRPLVRFAIEGEAEAEVLGCDVRTDLLSGTTFTACGVRVALKLWGRHAVRNALAALAAAREAGVPPEQAAPRLADLEPQPGRGRILRPDSELVLVDETYNANPEADCAVLEALGAARWRGRRVAVLGDMLELGDRAPALHRRVGAAAAHAGLDLLVCAGRHAADLAAGAREAGLSAIAEFPSTEALLPELPGLIRPGDLVLLKASRGLRFERLRDVLAAGSVRR